MRNLSEEECARGKKAIYSTNKKNKIPKKLGRPGLLPPERKLGWNNDDDDDNKVNV